MNLYFLQKKNKRSNTIIEKKFKKKKIKIKNNS
jgi:hypothetical protein